MKHFDLLIKISFGLADIALIIGIFFKLTGIVVLGLGPYSYFGFSALCLLYAIALSLTQIALHTRKQYLRENS